jgi:hypothetical protein
MWGERRSIQITIHVSQCDDKCDDSDNNQHEICSAQMDVVVGRDEMTFSVLLCEVSP